MLIISIILASGASYYYDEINQVANPPFSSLILVVHGSIWYELMGAKAYSNCIGDPETERHRIPAGFHVWRWQANVGANVTSKNIHPAMA
jgi:hypothetical protein